MRAWGLAAMAALTGTLLLVWLLLPEDVRPPSRVPPAVPAAPASAAPARPAAALAPEGPRFDVARVGGRGMLVTAGRAAAGAEVVLREGQATLGRGRADSRGEWVILPVEPLAPGVRELSLTSQLPGQDAVPGRDTVVLVVPEQPAAAPAQVAGGTRPTPPAGGAPAAAEPPVAPLALLLPPTAGRDSTPRLLQGPPTAVEAPAGAAGAAPAGAAPAAGRARLNLDVVDYDEGGSMRFAGSAPPGSTVRVYVGPQHAGDAVADPNGRWSMAPAEQPSVGRHSLRVDQLAATGSVAARIEVPFQRDPVTEPLVQDGRIVVQPGYSLWRISRRVYGRGTRYTVIYQANREQIRDPRLIYPGQVFTVPPDGGASPRPRPVAAGRSGGA